jgi:hypothetical protein
VIFSRLKFCMHFLPPPFPTAIKCSYANFCFAAISYIFQILLFRHSQPWLEVNSITAGVHQVHPTSPRFLLLSCTSLSNPVCSYIRHRTRALFRATLLLQFIALCSYKAHVHSSLERLSRDGSCIGRALHCYEDA